MSLSQFLKGFSAWFETISAISWMRKEAVSSMDDPLRHGDIYLKQKNVANAALYIKNHKLNHKNNKKVFRYNNLLVCTTYFAVLQEYF